MAIFTITTSPVTTAAGFDHPENLICRITATPEADRNRTLLEWELLAGPCANAENAVACSNVLLVIDDVEVYRDDTQGVHSYKAGERLASGSLTVDHREDGTRTVEILVQAGIYQWAVNSTYEGELELDPIARGLAYIGGMAYRAYIEDGGAWYRYAAELS